jgi:ribose transport system substrate-binding protein
MAAVAGTACGSSSSEDEAAKKQIDRVDIGNSPFNPDDLDAIVDDMVEELQQTEEQEFLISVVPKGLDQYFEPIVVGANRAIAELGLSGAVEAPSSTDDADLDEEQQRELLEGRLEDGYQGIGVAPFGETITDVINDFVDADVPVVTFDSDLPDSDRQLYMGTNNGEAGKTGGETLVELLTESEGSVVVLGHEGWPAGAERTHGAIDAIEDAGYETIFYELGWAEDEVALGAEEVPALMEDADPPVVGMIGVFSNAFRAAEYAEALDYEPGELQIVAFDFEPETLSYMEDGYIQATHAQRQYYMGYMLPYVVYSIHALGLKATKNLLDDRMIDSSSFDTGIDVVEADQLDDFNNFLDSLGIGG